MPEDAVALVAASLGTSTARARRLARTALPPGSVRSARAAAARGRPVLLVEGATDAAVLTVLLGGDGPLVVAAGGKHVLPLAAAVAGAVGADWHVLVDGDGDGWQRAANRSRARATHARSTRRVLDALPPQRCTVLPDALEAELAGWPSFVAALRRLGGELSGPAAKDPARYAAAAAAAGTADAPERLVALRRLTRGRRPGPPGG
ncbi:hypothetical protein [Kineococcus indalonis]|uniref:hypothetical protein n=1 Tax=Kineococcus indalonis TaxID=2696566 RepID=UPI0014136E2D|nr:hypothetical protein [Kineococcus indalonis]NAZ87726.1 hypothetical protein [Kineococcus indalonis]